ncbi:MAG: hypothetical protein K2G33_05060 [Duncaniella sp.]|nr:hypothetical protein [Duncaniella sp.]
MKIKNIYGMAIAAVLVSLPLASCSNDDDYQPGPGVEPGNPSVYFPLQEEYSYIFGSDEQDKTFDITVKRLDSNGAVSVPVIVAEGSENSFSLPSEIQFADGESETTLKVDCSSLPTKQACTLTVSIPEAYSNPYAEGTSEVTVSSLVSDWELWAENAEFTFSYYYGTIHSDIYAMPGTYKFRIDNFLGSGIDLPFEVKDPKDSYATIYPLANADAYVNYYPDDAFQCWYLYDEATGDYPTWSPDGTSLPKIAYALIYTYGDGYSYAYIRFAQRTGSFTIDTEYDDGSYNWQYVNFSYAEPLFDMF